MLLVGEVFGLFPMVRFCDELQEAFPGCNGHEHPIERHENAVFGDMADAASHAGDRRCIDEDEVPDEQAECTHGIDGWGEELVDDCRTGDKPQKRHEPIEWIDELSQAGAADEQVELNAVPEAKSPMNSREIAAMHKICLDVTFDPA